MTSKLENAAPMDAGMVAEKLSSDPEIRERIIGKLCGLSSEQRDCNDLIWELKEQLSELKRKLDIAEREYNKTLEDWLRH